MDFGIAKDGATKPARLTATGAGHRHAGVHEPGAGRGERIDFRSDIYALGIVIYEIFTGHVPFRGDTPVATIFKHIQDPVPINGGPAARIPPAAIPILLRALSKDRTGRYDSASEMAVALRQARAEGPWPGGGVTVPLPPVVPAGGPTSGSVTMTASTPSSHDDWAERRRSTRLEIFVNFQLKRVGTLGTVLQEERTIAENISRNGARVMTSMNSVAIGDVVQLEEVGGNFKTRAEVRNAYVGRDKIRRLNLRFVDDQAPDRLVKTDKA